MLNGEPTFELTETTLERIIFAMEDQTKSRIIDLRTGELVAKPEGELPINLASPPAWTPADGFRMMENFCGRLKNLELKRALLKSLSHGKGVFKAFRQVLSEYPQEDLQFREYKNAVLRRYIESWMDDMRESLGLSRLGPEPEEYEELLDEEFSVEYCGMTDRPFDMGAIVEEACADSLDWLPVSAALLEKREVVDFMDARRADGFIYYITEEEGCPIATAAGAVIQVEGRSIGIVRFLYVTKDFRDLGLEFRILDRISALYNEKGVEHIIVCGLYLRPEFVEKLTAKGLRILGSQFLLG
ncbi:MAG TPA: hypothetical protein VN445_01025 [Rectinemataceae bacterium]|nr:hypothetical protein [Rectinemataceae bacterium]